MSDSSEEGLEPDPRGITEGDHNKRAGDCEAPANPAELAQEFEPSDQCIRNWVKQADRDSGKRQDGLTSEEKAELARLRRENRTLREERAILAKAAAWFARETGKIPPGSSNS